jgi:hypothetical protein
MSFGAGDGGNLPGPTGMLASEANREAVQALLKQAYEDQRLTLDEFEGRVGKAIAARTLDELADLTRDLPAAPVPPPAPPRRPRRVWLLTGGIAVIALAGLIVALVQVLSSGTAPSSRTGAAQPAGKVAQPAGKAAPGPGGPAHCPVGTGATALAIANALAGDPVYVDPASPPLTAAQADRLRTAISSADPTQIRIRIAAVTPATVRKGGGERTLTNAIASCPADSAGVTVVTTTTSTYLVTSYADSQAASQAVEAALNTHASLAAGLKDAVRRLAIVDKSSS